MSPPRIAHPYQAYGLNILSGIEMPGWTEGAAPWDVSIDHGAVPAELPGARCLSGVCWVRGEQCLLNYARVGRLLVESGRRLTVEFEVGGDSGMMRMLIAGTGLATALYQRGQICLHASAVAKDGKAYLFMGHSGAGKSTLASALLQRGYDFISDDICVVEPGADGAFEVVQSYPSLRLCRDSYRELDLAEEASSIDLVDDKHRIRPAVAGAPKRAVVERICLLGIGSAAVAASEPITGVERIKLIQRNLFRPRIAKLVGDKKRLLLLSIGLAQRLDLRRIVRPPSGFDLDRLCALATG